MAESDNDMEFDRQPDQVDPTGSGCNNEGELSEDALNEASGGLLRYGNLSQGFNPQPPPISPVLQPSPPPIKPVLAPSPPPIKEGPTPPPT